MCCLFGLIDTELRFTGKEKSKMLHALASASEARGTDATGVAYDSGRNLHIYKKPIPGHKLNFYVRDNSRFAMGHTRMTTRADLGLWRPGVSSRIYWVSSRFTTP